jgi:hypothetical protein
MDIDVPVENIIQSDAGFVVIFAYVTPIKAAKALNDSWIIYGSVTIK